MLGATELLMRRGDGVARASGAGSFVEQNKVLLWEFRREHGLLVLRWGRKAGGPGREPFLGIRLEDRKVVWGNGGGLEGTWALGLIHGAI